MIGVSRTEDIFIFNDNSLNISGKASCEIQTAQRKPTMILKQIMSICKKGQKVTSLISESAMNIKTENNKSSPLLRSMEHDGTDTDVHNHYISSNDIVIVLPKHRYKTMVY